MKINGKIGGKTMSGRLLLMTGFLFFGMGPVFGGGYSVMAQPAPASGLRLIGTIEGGAFTGAVLDDGKGGQDFYHLNEKLPDESRIVKVRSDHIVLKSTDGTMTELYIQQGAVGAGGVSVPAARRNDPVLNDDGRQKTRTSGVRRSSRSEAEE